MNLTERHRDFCRFFFISGNATDSYIQSFKTNNRGTAKVAACRLLKKQEIKTFLDALTDEKRKLLMREREKEISKFKSEILQELEIDLFLSNIVRGDVEIEKIIPIKEYIPKRKGDPNSGKWTVRFIKYKCKPNLRERLAASHQLYMRMGSYNSSKKDNASEDSEITKSEEVVIILSDGTRLPIS